MRDPELTQPCENCGEPIFVWSGPHANGDPPLWLHVSNYSQLEYGKCFRDPDERRATPIIELPQARLI